MTSLHAFGVQVIGGLTAQSTRMNEESAVYSRTDVDVLNVPVGFVKSSGDNGHGENKDAMFSAVGAGLNFVLLFVCHFVCAR